MEPKDFRSLGFKLKKATSDPEINAEQKSKSKINIPKMTLNQLNGCALIPNQE